MKIRNVIKSIIPISVIASPLILSACNRQNNESFDIINAIKTGWQPSTTPLSAQRLDPDEMLSKLVEESKKNPSFFIDEIKYSIIQQAKAWEFENQTPIFKIQISNFSINNDNTFNFNVVLNMHFKTKGNSIIAPDFDLTGEIKNLKSVYAFVSNFVEGEEIAKPQFINCAPGTLHLNFGSHKEYMKLNVNGKYLHGDPASLETDFDLSNANIIYTNNDWTDTGIDINQRDNVCRLLWGYLNGPIPYYFQNISSYQFLTHSGSITVTKAEEIEIEISFITTGDTPKMHKLTDTYYLNCGLWTQSGSQLTNGIVFKDIDGTYKIKVTTDTSYWTSGNCKLKFYCSDYKKAPYLQAYFEVPVVLTVND